MDLHPSLTEMEHSLACAGFTGTMEAELDDAGCGWIEGVINGAD